MSMRPTDVITAIAKSSKREILRYNSLFKNTVDNWGVVTCGEELVTGITGTSSGNVTLDLSGWGFTSVDDYEIFTTVKNNYSAISARTWVEKLSAASASIGAITAQGDAVGVYYVIVGKGFGGGSGSGGGGTVDQTYNATSTNAQSGTAVAEALATVDSSTTFDVAAIPQGPTGANEINAVMSNKDSENARVSYVRQSDGTLPNTVNLGVNSGLGEDSFELTTPAYVNLRSAFTIVQNMTTPQEIWNAINMGRALMFRTAAGITKSVLSASASVTVAEFICATDSGEGVVVWSVDSNAAYTSAATIFATDADLDAKQDKLVGGLKGQVPVKVSAADGDVAWGNITDFSCVRINSYQNNPNTPQVISPEYNYDDLVAAFESGKTVCVQVYIEYESNGETVFSELARLPLIYQPNISTPQFIGEGSNGANYYSIQIYKDGDNTLCRLNESRTGTLYSHNNRITALETLTDGLTQLTITMLDGNNVSHTYKILGQEVVTP